MTLNTDTQPISIESQATIVEIAAWRDALAVGGIRADSDDALLYLSPIIGPTSVLLLHRLARGLTSDCRTSWTMHELAGSFGVTTSLLARSLDRLERFGLARRFHTRIEVRVQIPPLPTRHIDRLPDYLAAAYHHRQVTS